MQKSTPFFFGRFEKFVCIVLLVEDVMVVI